jgi:hypothetical protein
LLSQLLLALDFDDDWLDNPVISESWGLTWQFKEDFDDGFQVSGQLTVTETSFSS